MARREINLPEGFEIEAPPEFELPAGFEIEPPETPEEVIPYWMKGKKGKIAEDMWRGLYGEGPEPSKTLWEAVQHGWRQAGIRGVKGLAGLARAEAEIGGKFRKKFWETQRWKPEYLEKMDKSLKEWSELMVVGVEEYYRQNPKEAMQLDEDAGFLAT
ncbi:unnamed protein product, partial [marine sediment metagenome]